MSDHSELKQLAKTLLACDRYTDFAKWAAALDAFEDASGPDVVLALIGEIDGLRMAEGDAMTYKAGMENVAHQRDQLEAEVDVLRKRQQSANGYTDAFYKVASLLGIGARPLPPMEVFHGEVVPMLEAALKNAERWKFVRYPLGRQSPYAVWREGRQVLFSQMADEAIDAAMSKEAAQ